MNQQNILKNRGTKFDLILDSSEYYDYELDNIIIGKVDVVLDNSELYDYKLGDNKIDFIYYESFITTDNMNLLITEDNFIFSTQDNYLIEYTE